LNGERAGCAELSQLAANVVAQAEVTKRDAVHVFGGHNGGVETVEHNILGGRKAARTLVAVVAVTATGARVAVNAESIVTRPVIAVSAHRTITSRPVRARAVGSWTVVAAET
jgi:hypothetical protein